MRGVINSFVSYLTLETVPEPDVPCDRCFTFPDNSCYNCTEIPITDINITTSSTFTATRVHGTLTINSGAILTINNTVEFTPTSRLVIENGAKLILDGGKLTNCNDQSSEFEGIDFESSPWQGVFVAGNQFAGQPNIGGPPELGLSGMIEVKNGGVIEHAEIGIRNYLPSQSPFGITQQGGLIDLQIGSQINNCGIGIDFAPFSLGWFGNRDDKSRILQSNIRNCGSGIKIFANVGVDIIGNDITNCDFGLELLNGTSSNIGLNTFDQNGDGIRVENPYPSILGLNISSNSFDVSVGVGINFEAQGNASFHDITNNIFYGPGTGILKLGLNQNRIRNNDFFDTNISILESYTGENMSNFTFDNSIISEWGILADGTNSDIFLTNCFDFVQYDGISLWNNTTIFPQQSGNNGEAAGNCFNTNGYKINASQSPGVFDYFLLNNTPISSCGHPGFNGFDIELTDQFLTQGLCGSAFNTNGLPPRFRGCDIPTLQADKDAMEVALKAEILRIQNLPFISIKLRTYLIARLKRCLDKLQRENLIQINQESGREAAIQYASTRDRFEIKLFAYTMMMEVQEYTRALAFIQSLTTERTDQSDFISGQLIYIRYLMDKVNNYPSANELNLLSSNGSERNEYAGFSRTVYYLITGNRLGQPFPDWNSSARFNTNTVDPIENKEFNIYPNPTQDIINIKPLGGSRNYNIQLLDINGRILIEKLDNTTDINIDISHLNNGVYFVKILQENN